MTLPQNLGSRLQSRRKKYTVSTSGPKETQAVDVTDLEVEEASSVPPYDL